MTTNPAEVSCRAPGLLCIACDLEESFAPLPFLAFLGDHKIYSDPPSRRFLVRAAPTSPPFNCFFFGANPRRFYFANSISGALPPVLTRRGLSSPPFPNEHSCGDRLEMSFAGVPLHLALPGTTDFLWSGRAADILRSLVLSPLLLSSGFSDL